MRCGDWFAQQGLVPRANMWLGGGSFMGQYLGMYLRLYVCDREGGGDCSAGSDSLQSR